MARPEHQPTEALRATVKDLASFKVSHSQMSNYLGITEKTLRKHYRVEIDAGVVDLVTTAGNTIRSAAKRGDIDSAKFILSRVGNWGPTSTVSVSSEGVAMSIQETYDKVITGNNKKNVEEGNID